MAERDDHCICLATMPLAYSLAPGREGSGVRRRPHRDYLIVYCLDPQGEVVEVLHVLKGAQHYKAILFPADYSRKHLKHP